MHPCVRVVASVLTGVGVVLGAMGGAQAQGKVVTLATLEWPPYIGEKLKNQGYVAEIVKEAFQRAGYTTKFNFLPWARAVDDSKSGAIDGYFPEYYDDSRLNEFSFSKEFPGGPVGFYKRKDLKVEYKHKDYKALSKYKFGVVRDYINEKDFDAASYLKKEEAVSDEKNLVKLYNKRVDFIFIDKLVAEYIIATEHKDYAKDLEFVEPPIEVKPLYVCFGLKAKDHDAKLKAFNDAVEAMLKDGSVKKILEKNNIKL